MALRSTLTHLARRLACIVAVCALGATSAWAQPPDPTPGGAGGRIVRVTSLAKEGPGTLAAALAEQGPRIVVFEVGGAIDLQRSRLKIVEPYVTVAGQTAPSPGITLIRGGIDVRTHDVVLRHLSVYGGADGQLQFSGWEPDAFSAIAAHHVLVEHCTFMWGIDENMSASGPRFAGSTIADWRAGTSHDIVFRLNVAAEGLANASHSKGEHSKGSLVHDNATGIVFDRNVWAHNVERSPLVKGGAHVLLVNNLIYNPGRRAVHYNLLANEWLGHEPVVGEITAVGNVLRGGDDTPPGLPFLLLGGIGDLLYYGRDNRAVDRFGKALPMVGRYGETRARLIESEKPLAMLDGYDVLPSGDVEEIVLAEAGARPWDRGAADGRVLNLAVGGRGRIIDDENEVGGYPRLGSTRAAFVDADWDMDTLTPRGGRYPGQAAVPPPARPVRDQAARPPRR